MVDLFVIWGTQLTVWVLRLICNGWGVDIAPESDAWMCLSHITYLVFDKIPLFLVTETLWDWELLEYLREHFG